MNALITGSTKGIGKAISEMLAKKGYNLALCARNLQELEKQQSAISKVYPQIKIFILSIDCSKKEAVQSFADRAIAEFGFIDVLVNNVGLFNQAMILNEEDNFLE